MAKNTSALKVVAARSKFDAGTRKKFDAVVVGKNTFETSKVPLLKRNTIVLTSAVKTTEEKFPHVWFVNYKTIDLNKFVKKLGFNKVAILGGSKVYSYCLAKGLMDEIYLTLEPAIFGKGINLFAEDVLLDKKFKLFSIKKLNKQGSLLLQYKK